MILAPVAQRRNRDRKDVETIVQVAAEASRADFLGQISIGRGDHPHVHIDSTRTAEPFDLALLEHPQQLRLELERQFPDLVEQNGPSMRQLEPANLGRMGAGERATLAAEELALDQVGGKRGAVDDDERSGAARAAAVDRPGQQFLAGAGFS